MKAGLILSLFTLNCGVAYAADAPAAIPPSAGVARNNLPPPLVRQVLSHMGSYQVGTEDLFRSVQELADDYRKVTSEKETLQSEVDELHKTPKCEAKP